MTGRSLTTSIEGIEKAKKALGSNSLNQTALARELGLSRSTVTNFFRQIPIERLNFNDIEFGLADKSGNFIPWDYDSANALKIFINNIICYISLQIDVNEFCISPEFKKVFQELKQKLPDLEGDENTYNQWWQVNGQNWMKQLREVLIKYRNIAHDWQFNDKEKQLLENYYHVNILLIDCINSNCRVSSEMRSQIEDTLLLPIEEIEKRPFKYQE
ncbi:hypothetical protein PN492_19715 [Dolichospermum circinale CS-537/01]|uniref:NACHT conflict system C-terminal helical domain-containing protein n=1 Tax=Dolichospermum circinale CS-537/01 TaxID=3021739 RepID=A0ABT5ABB5_9CYAN|nr:hypothetical protein [Dolichospermum circinale]MDB9488749.1 hypothetical protein [Dolichospermum circinale CS-537/01]